MIVQKHLSMGMGITLVKQTIFPASLGGGCPQRICRVCGLQVLKDI